MRKIINIAFCQLLGVLSLFASGQLYAQTDLALSKPASASTADLPASNAFDGNGATRWASAANVDPSWLMVDLGASKSLTSVVIDWEAANAANYRIEGSANNSTWVTLATKTGGTFGARTDTLGVSGSYRYVRMWGTARSPGNSWGYSIWSMKVMGTATNTNVGPAGYTLCASENQTCSFTGTRSVAYGANGSFNYKTATGSIGCNNATFGDPISGVAKSCYYGADTSSNLPVAYAGYTGVYPGYTLKLDERFDSFNTSIWAKGDGAVGGESICRFQPQGVQVVGGNLELVIRNEYVPGSYSYDHKADKGPYNYSCGELRTVPSKRIKYGRIEARVKAPSRAVAKGYIASLFTYVQEGSPREWEEIDMELEGGRPDMFQANLIYGVNVADWNGTRQWGAWEHKINIAPADQWRVYAIEWAPTFMKWYVDGVLVKTLDKDWMDCLPSCVAPQVTATPVPDNLTDLMMNFWIPNDGIQNVFGGNKTGNVYPMTTQYDWVRIYSLNSNPLTKW